MIDLQLLWKFIAHCYRSNLLVPSWHWALAPRDPVITLGPPRLSRIISPSQILNIFLSATSLLPHEVPYSQVLGLRTWTSLRESYLPTTDLFSQSGLSTMSCSVTCPWKWVRVNACASPYYSLQISWADPVPNTRIKQKGRYPVCTCWTKIISSVAQLTTGHWFAYPFINSVSAITQKTLDPELLVIILGYEAFYLQTVFRGHRGGGYARVCCWQHPLPTFCPTSAPRQRCLICFMYYASAYTSYWIRGLLDFRGGG